MHVLGQSFSGDLPTTKETAIDVSKFTGSNGVENKTVSNGELSYTATTTNPYVYVPHKTVLGYRMITEIAESTVDALVVKDASGTHSTLDEVDWSTAE